MFAQQQDIGCLPRKKIILGAATATVVTLLVFRVNILSVKVFLCECEYTNVWLISRFGWVRWNWTWPISLKEALKMKLNVDLRFVWDSSQKLSIFEHYMPIVKHVRWSGLVWFKSCHRDKMLPLEYRDEVLPTGTKCCAYERPRTIIITDFKGKILSWDILSQWSLWGSKI